MKVKFRYNDDKWAYNMDRWDQKVANLMEDFNGVKLTIISSNGEKLVWKVDE